MQLHPRAALSAAISAGAWEITQTCVMLAAAHNVARSTISRELERHGGHGHYSPIQANKDATERRGRTNNAKKFIDADWRIVDACLHQRFSPEQISNRPALTKKLKISHQTIYTHVRQDKSSGGILSTLLRAKKTHHKRCEGGAKKRDIIKNRISIALRPAIVEEKSRIGDFEADTVMGKNHQGAIVTLVDRHSRYTFACALPTKGAKGVTKAIKALLKPHRDRCHTIHL